MTIHIRVIEYYLLLLENSVKADQWLPTQLFLYCSYSEDIMVLSWKELPVLPVHRKTAVLKVATSVLILLNLGNWMVYAGQVNKTIVIRRTSSCLSCTVRFYLLCIIKDMAVYYYESSWVNLGLRQQYPRWRSQEKERQHLTSCLPSRFHVQRKS